MDGLLIGCARVSTDEQNLTAQREALAGLGVASERMYVDHGLTGTNRDRPGLREALAACRSGDTLVVTKLDRLARSLPDARAIVEDLTRRKVRLSLGGSLHDPTDPVGRLLFNVLAMVAEFEGDLIRMRTPEGDAGRPGQGSPPGQAAEAERAPRGPPRRPSHSGRPQRGRARRPVRRRPLDGLPGPPARLGTPPAAPWSHGTGRERVVEDHPNAAPASGSPCGTGRRNSAHTAPR